MSPSIVFEKADEICVNASKLKSICIKLYISHTDGKERQSKLTDCFRNMLRNFRPGRSVLVSLFPLFKPRRRENYQGLVLMLIADQEVDASPIRLLCYQGGDLSKYPTTLKAVC